MLKKNNLIIFLLLLPVIAFTTGYFSVNRADALNNVASTSVTVLVVCGDGTKDPYEVCDKGNPPSPPSDFGGLTCGDYGYNSGNLICSDDCSQILINRCYTCGNAIKEEAEECDGGDFGGQSCRSFGYNTGNLSCTGQCRINLTDCTNVGNMPGGSVGGNIGGGGTSGGGGGGFNTGRDTPLAQTKVVIKGTAYPQSNVNVLKDSALLGVVKADLQANFNYENTEITPGMASFSFWSEDKNKLRSILYTLSFRVSSNAVTTITGVHIPPTISADKFTLKNGEDITIFGSSIPLTDVFVEIHSPEDILEKIVSDDDGEWTIVYNTKKLADNQTHTAKAYFQRTVSGATVKSGFSGIINFDVGEAPETDECKGADLNKDGRVNLMDFSILLYHWGTNNSCADQNKNGKVELGDFSIMMYFWTG